MRTRMSNPHETRSMAEVRKEILSAGAEAEETASPLETDPSGSSIADELEVEDPAATHTPRAKTPEEMQKHPDEFLGSDDPNATASADLGSTQAVLDREAPTGSASSEDQQKPRGDASTPEAATDASDPKAAPKPKPGESKDEPSSGDRSDRRE